MSNHPKGRAFQQTASGIMVSKSLTLAANATASIFTVSGGMVRVTGLVGIVTVAVANTASLTAKFAYDPDGATAQGDLCAATGITADAVNTLYVLPLSGLPTDLMSEVTTAGSEAPTAVSAANAPDIYLTSGSMKFVTSNHDPVPGAVTFYLTYFPLATGAGVVAA